MMLLSAVMQIQFWLMSNGLRKKMQMLQRNTDNFMHGAADAVVKEYNRHRNRSSVTCETPPWTSLTHH